MENTFGKYRIAAPITTRSSHSTYRARPVTVMEWGYVVKVYNDRRLPSVKLQEEWRRSMDALMRLEHPHILSILEIGVEEDVPYSVTKYMERGSLRDRLNSIFPAHLALHDVQRIILQAGNALQYAHGQQILHGNIKPENVLFDDRDNVLLSDFRLSQELDATDPNLPVAQPPAQEIGEGSDASRNSRLTYYPALEKLDEKSDQYALGCLAYAMLAGRWQTATLSADLPSGQLLPGKTSLMTASIDQEGLRQVEVAVRKAMAEEPGRRYENIAAFLEAFELACKMSDVSAVDTQALAGVSSVSTPPENRTVARLIQDRNFAWQLPVHGLAKAYVWPLVAPLSRLYQTGKTQVAWRLTAIVVPLLLLVIFCVMLIAHFTSSPQHTWQAVGSARTPTLTATNSATVIATSQTAVLASSQHVVATVVSSARTVPPATVPPIGVTTASVSTSGSNSYSARNSSHADSSSDSSSGSSSDSSSGSSSEASSGSSPGSLPTPTPTPAPLPTPTPTPTPLPTPTPTPTPKPTPTPTPTPTPKPKPRCWLGLICNLSDYNSKSSWKW